MNDRDSRSIGACMKMCPDSEIKMREKENLLHPFEVAWDHCPQRPKADCSKMVKCYRRPTVGKDDNLLSEIRSPWILHDTVNYLIDSIASLDRNWPEIYDFIFDRLRAVRQDLVIQDAAGADCIEILEKAVRFHLYSDYRLCTHDISVFDPKINSQHIQECLKRLLNFYKSSERPCDNRSEFESAYILFNLGDVDALNHCLSLDKNIRSSPALQQAYEISLSYLLGNFIRCTRLIRQLKAPILLCAVHRHFPSIQRQILHTMSIAYNSKVSKFPISKLTDILCLNTDTETQKLCEQFGLNIVGSNVQLMKSSFTDTAVGRQHLDFITTVVKQQTITDLLHGKSLTTEDSLVKMFAAQCNSLQS